MSRSSSKKFLVREVPRRKAFPHGFLKPRSSSAVKQKGFIKPLWENTPVKYDKSDMSAIATRINRVVRVVDGRKYFSAVEREVVAITLIARCVRRYVIAPDKTVLNIARQAYSRASGRKVYR